MAPEIAFKQMSIIAMNGQMIIPITYNKQQIYLPADFILQVSGFQAKSRKLHVCHLTCD